MKRLMPTRTEVYALLIGFSLGTIAGAWFLGTWGLFVIMAPLIVIVSACLYFYYKQKQQFQLDLLKAKIPEEILKNHKDK